MIFPILELERIVQVGDKTRLNATKTFSNVDEITSVEIDPDNTGTFYDVYNEDETLWYLDFVYGVAGIKTVVVKVNSTEIKNYTLEVISEVDDNLFSNDRDIVAYESDLMKWVVPGRSSFLDKHRTAQIEILNDLDSDGVWKCDGTRYVAADIIDIQEFKEWSKFATLRIIFESLSNEIGDIFALKAEKYNGQMVKAMRRAVLRLSPNGTDDAVKRQIFSGDLIRA